METFVDGRGIVAACGGVDQVDLEEDREEGHEEEVSCGLPTTVSTPTPEGHVVVEIREVRLW